MQRQFLRTGITLGSFKLDVATVMSQQGEFDPNCHKSLDNDIHTGIDDIDTKYNFHYYNSSHLDHKTVQIYERGEIQNG